MNGLLSDLRFAFRMLVRTPLLSLAAILTVGIGIGSTAFALTFAHGTLFADLPVRDADRLTLVRETRPEEGADEMGVPFQDYRDFRDRQTSFEELEAGYWGTVNLAGDDGPPERYTGAFVTAGSLSMLGVPPVLGRTFREGEDAPGAPPVVILGHGAWRSRFGSDPRVVGRTVRVNGETAEIVGVMPPGFGFPFASEIWVPLPHDPAELGRREGISLLVYGYRRPGVSLAAARAEVEAIARGIEEEHPRANEGISATVVPFTEGFMPEDVPAMIYLVLAMVAGVLLVACANVANLLLARVSSRQREVAVRSALGASRFQVIRQLLAEAVVLGIGGGLVGVVVGHYALRGFNGALEGIERPFWIVYELDAPMLLAIAAVTFVVAIASGTLPALRASGSAIADTLRDESRGSSSLRMGRLASGIVVMELAVSCGLMIAAGLLARTLMEMNSVELGFDVESVMTARVGLFESDYPDPAARSRFYHDVLDRLGREPGVEAAALTTGLPATPRQSTWPVRVEGREYDTPEDVPLARGATVTAGFFETFGVDFLEGRGFRRAESERGGERVAVVNRSFVESELGGGSALGRRIRIAPGELPDSMPDRSMRIVGVIPDLHHGVDPFGSGREISAAVYRPLGMADARFMSLAVRTRGPPDAFRGRLRAAVADIDPDLPLYWVRTMEAALDETRFFHRIFSVLFTVFGGAALFLAAVGLYGVIDFSVSARTREMGVRMAFGASAREVLALIYGRVGRQLVAGLVPGVALGALLARPLSAIMFGVEAWDPLVYGAIVGLMALTALAAALRPAVRAVRVDPVNALGTE